MVDGLVCDGAGLGTGFALYVDLEAWLAVAHVLDDRKDWAVAAEVEEVEYLPGVDSNREEDRQELVRVLVALELDHRHPIEDQAEHQRQRPDTAEGERPAEQGGFADWACRWIDRHYEVVAGVP